MSSTDMSAAQELIRELGELLKLPELVLNEHGVAGLIADKQFSVNIEYSPSDEVLHFYAKVMDISGPMDDALSSRLMAFNAYGNETSGGTLAWDELHHEIILCKRVDMLVCTADYLKIVLEIFMDQVERWKNKLARGIDSLNEESTEEQEKEELSSSESPPLLMPSSLNERGNNFIKG